MSLLVSLAFLASTGSSASTAAPLAPASQILETYADSLTAYQATAKTKVQDLRPLATQRGVTLDGGLRAAPMLPMHLAGNPFENVWNGHEKQGDLRIDTGTYGPSEVDLAIPATGMTWVIGRTFNARATDSGGSQYDSDGPMGRNWALSSQPEIVLYDDATNTKDVLYLVYRADAYVEFDRAGTSSTEYKGKNGAAGCFHYVAGSPDTWEYTDQAGYVFTFFGFNTSGNTCNGQLWKIADPESTPNVAYIGDKNSASTAISNGYDGSGRIKMAVDPSDRRYTYSYSAGTYGGKSRLETVVCETHSGGTWASSPTGIVEIARVAYAYYGSADSHGDGGDLKTVTLTTPLSDSSVSQVQTKYYRYWEGSSDNVSAYNSSTNAGYVHQLKYIYDFEGVRRYDWLDATFDDDETDSAVSDDTLVPYAAAYFEYDSSHRINKTWANGACGCSGATNGVYTFTFDTNGSYTNNSGYDTTWCSRTVVAKPDGSYLTQYFDELGQALSSVVTDIIPTSSSPTPKKWVTYVVRNSNGCTTEVHRADNVTAYTHSTGAITTSSSVGLVNVFTRTSSGDVTGFVTERRVQNGTSGALYYEGKTSWDATTLTKTITDAKIVRPLVSTSRTYPTATTTDAGYEETSYSYAAYGSPATLTPETVTTTLPVVSTGNNGSGSANTRSVHSRRDGLVDYVKNEDGTIDYFDYTNGEETTRIRDADTGSLTEPTGFTSSGTALQDETLTTYTAQGLVSSQTLHGLDTIKQYPQTYRSKLADRRMIILQFPDYASGSSIYYGPVQFQVVNQAGKTEASGTISLSGNSYNSATTSFIDETDPDPITATDLGTVSQMRTVIYDQSGTRATEDRAYFSIPGSGAGTEGPTGNYDATTYGYDGSGTRWRVKEPNGTIQRTVTDTIGRRSETWIGTNDHSFSGGESTGTDNMVKVEAVDYDSGSDGKTSLVSSVTRFVEDSPSGQRVTSYIYDWRGREIVEIPPTAPYVLHKVDNRGREIARGQYSSSSGLGATSDPTSLSTNRLALSESAFDELGRLWKSTRHKITQSTGADADNLTSLTWYDSMSRPVKVRGEQYGKTIYDRLGRVTDEYVLTKDNDAAYSDADDVTGDIVLEQYETRYDGTKSDVLMSVTIQRNFNDYGGGETTGALDTNADGYPLKVTVTPDLKGRAQITSNWYDQFGRVKDTVEFGTYGGSTFDRLDAGFANAPARSATALRTTTAYNTDGTVDTVTDPLALVTKYNYDALGRRTKEIKNYNSGVGSPGGSPYGTDQNVTVSYGYAHGLRTSLTAVMENSTNNQVTTYTHGTTKGTSAGDSKIATGDLLQKVTYPDSSGSTDVVTFAYNAQGQEIWKRDQAGTIIQTDFDLSGRATQKRATATGSGIDTAILRIATSYDSVGRVSEVDQYNDATVGNGTAPDGAALSYDDWGNVASYVEDKDSAISGGGVQYTTSYTWTKNAPTYGRYTVRKTAMTMPDSRSISYTYSSLGGSHDDENSRVTTVVDGGTTLAQYDYLGMGTVVGTKLNEISCFSRVHNGGSTYSDLDLFNRITTSRWTKDLSTDRDFYSVTLTYDQDSNITSALDNVHGVYHSSGAGWDVKYTMDNVNRLTQAEEGTLSGGSITSKTRDEQWTLSHTGNWDHEKLNLNGDSDFTDAGELDDTRTHNEVNELTARNTDSSGGNEYTLAYDLAGNMTDDGKDYTYVYDAWGRLRMVKTRGASPVLVAEYRYNGLNHRIAVHEDSDVSGTVDGSDPWYYDVFDERWRELARFRSSDANPKEDFVPHQAGASGRGGSSYIDLVICRNKDASTAWTAVADAIDERNYLCQNWRADVSAVVSSGSLLMEWVKYSAYGTPIGLPGGDTDSDTDCDITDRNQVQTWINGSTYDVRGDIDLDGDVDANDKSTIRGSYEGITLGRGVLSGTGVANRKGYAGYEVLSGLAGGKWLARNRVIAADLGRWTERDPLGYVDGMSMYAYASSNPVRFVDPSGTIVRLCNKGSGHRKENAYIECLFKCLHKSEYGRWVISLVTAQGGDTCVQTSPDEIRSGPGKVLLGETEPQDDHPIVNWWAARRTGKSTITLYSNTIRKFGVCPAEVLVHELYHAAQYGSQKGQDFPQAPPEGPAYKAGDTYNGWGTPNRGPCCDDCPDPYGSAQWPGLTNLLPSDQAPFGSSIKEVGGYHRAPNGQ